MFVWLRRSRRPRRVSDVPRTTGWQRSRVDGTARAPQVGRPQLVGVSTLSREGQSQRGAHKPEYRRRETCLRGDGIANIPTGGIPPLQGWEDVNGGWPAVIAAAGLATGYDILTDHRGVEEGYWTYTD